jgi:nitrite reductase/ring-hydroxylating ferredoxin subunit
MNVRFDGISTFWFESPAKLSTVGAKEFYRDQFVLVFHRRTRKMGFVKVASVKDLESGKMMSVEVADKEILLTNFVGEFYAIGNRCTHMSCMLSDGTLDGDKVHCVCHGSVFDVKTGSVVKGPAKISEPSFKVKVEGDQVLVDV